MQPFFTLYKRLNKYKLIKKIGFTGILFITFFLIILFFIYFFFLRSKKWLIVDMKITSDPATTSEYRSVPYWLINTVKKGDQEYDGLGQIVAEVVDIKTYETWGNYKEAYIKLKLNALYSSSQKKYSFSSKDLYIGGPLSVKPNGVLLEGIITAIEGITDTRKIVHKKVSLQIEGDAGSYVTSGVRPWIADTIQVGDEMKDFNGNIIAKVLEKKVEPAKRITINLYGNPLLVRDPYLVDLYLVMDLVTVEDKGLYYFKDNVKIKIFGILYYFTEKYDVSGKIINILE